MCPVWVCPAWVCPLKCMCKCNMCIAGGRRGRPHSRFNLGSCSPGWVELLALDGEQAEELPLSPSCGHFFCQLEVS